MKTLSTQFRTTKPGTPGRRASRHLNDEAVAEADRRAKDPKHQFKFLSSPQRMAVVRAEAF